MNMIEIITKKKLGQALTREEIVHFTRGAADGSIPDCFGSVHPLFSPSECVIMKELLFTLSAKELFI